jgi:long-chain acyl-CoA synthetase
MIISSGYNIYPQTIENVLDRHPDVLYSCVIGLPDEYRGQYVKAYIVLKNGVTVTDDVKNSIRTHCKLNIAKYLMPKEIEYRDVLPKTIIGKVDYRALELENSVTGG